MSTKIFFQCPHCEQTETLTLEEFRLTGVPRCPTHAVQMESKPADAAVGQAVEDVMDAVARLAVAAMSRKSGDDQR